MSSAGLCFTVIGRPQQKGSKRALLRPGARYPTVVEQNRQARPWAGRIAAEAATAARSGELLRGAVVVELEFFFARPKAHYGSGRYTDRVLASAPRHMTTTPDVDKLARCALDALTGVLFKDDAQVSELNLRKGYGAPERLEVRVIAL